MWQRSQPVMSQDNDPVDNRYSHLGYNTEYHLGRVII